MTKNDDFTMRIELPADKAVQLYEKWLSDPQFRSELMKLGVKFVNPPELVQPKEPEKPTSKN